MLENVFRSLCQRILVTFRTKLQCFIAGQTDYRFLSEMKYLHWTVEILSTLQFFVSTTNSDPFMDLLEKQPKSKPNSLEFIGI